MIIPTIFLHGFNGDVSSTNQMIVAAERELNLHKSMLIYVNFSGEITYLDDGLLQDHNPIIQIVFQNRFALHEFRINKLYEIVKYLKSHYHIQKINGIGHSLGANDFVDLELMYGSSEKLPKLNKLVTIAGLFNGMFGFLDRCGLTSILSNGAPKHMTYEYKQRLKYKNCFPSGIRLLNVIGKSDPIHNNDHWVSFSSARSVKFLLQDRLESYEEYIVTGPMGEHTALNRNSDVEHTVNEFIWSNDSKNKEFVSDNKQVNLKIRKII